MRKLISTILSAAVLATLAMIPGGAIADSRCDADLVLFSRSSSNLIGSVNWNGVACIPGDFVPAAKAIADGDADFRLINPNSDIILVRYAADDIPRRPDAVRLRLRGLGMDKKTFLTRTDIAIRLTGDEPVEPDWVYESGDVTIDPSQQGCLRVDAWYSVKRKVQRGGKTVTRWVRLWSETTTYHTFDTVSC